MATKKPQKKIAPAAAKKPQKAKAAKPAKTAKATPASAAPKNVSLVKSRYTKTQIISDIAEKATISKKQATTALDELTTIIERHVKKNAIGEFVLPGLFKIKTIKKKATKARKGINPFTGQETVFQAKPARTVVKILPLKGLKDMAV